MLRLQGVGQEVAHFVRGCEYLLSAVASRQGFSETERQLIAYYCSEIISNTEHLRDERETT